MQGFSEMFVQLTVVVFVQKNFNACEGLKQEIFNV